MKNNLKFIFLIILLSISLLTVHCITVSLTTAVYGDTHNAANCSQSVVQAAINSASDGDTVTVPAGSATWSGELAITKTIYLIGAGIGNTVISGNNRGDWGFLIAFSPDSAGSGLRISGFTFNITEQMCIWLDNRYHLPPHSNIRIDHNRFTNSSISGGAIFNYACRGLIDNNTFDNMRYPLRIGWGSRDGGTWDWNNFPELVWGTPDDSMYVEDNTISVNVCFTICDQDGGGRYVFRYNQFNSICDMYPWLDIHGGRGSLTSLRGGFGGEVYGNIYNRAGFLISHRGGRLALHHNNASAGGSYNIYSNTGCPYEEKEKINNSYIFINRRGLSGSLIGWGTSAGDDCGGVVVENSTFWMSNSNCTAPNTCSNIITGVGCGTLANRPTNCTTGTAYWATNQSCADLTGMVGVNPATPISGTLYKCTATNTWTAYYTPLAYPHPLRGGTDTTPPGAPGTVRDGTSAILDFVFTYSTSQLSANWDPSTDAETGIFGYKYAIGTRPAGTDVASWTTLGNVLTVTKTGLSLSVGTTYYFSVKAVNGVSLEGAVTNSNGQYSRVWVPDTTGPVMGAVRDGTGNDIDAANSQTQLSANWDAAAEPETAVNLYSYAIGTTAGGTNVRGWTSIGVNPSITATGLGLTVGQVYYFSVKAQNTDGYWGAAANSDGQTVIIYTTDTTGPVMGAVRDGTGQDINTTDSQVQLQANWDAAAEPETAVNLYSYAIGTTAGGTNVRGWTSIGVNRSITATGLGLTGGQVYYFSVKAQNTDGYWGQPANSNGQLVIGDTSPPGAPGAVRDGTSATADSVFTFSTTQLAANWNAAIDNESGISNYQFSIGTTPGGTQTSGWATIGNVLSVTKTGLSLSVGTTYYFSVKAQNGNGLQSGAANSNGQYVVKVDTADTTPPTTPAQVRDGLGADTGYTYSITQLSANWDDSTDTGSGIARYQYAIGTRPAGTDVANWTNTNDGINTEVTRAGLSLTVGTTYYFSVRAVNGVGLPSSARNSNGQVVLEDSSLVAPVIFNVVVSATVSGVAITWNTDRPCTGYVEYGQTPVYGFFSAPGTFFVTGHAADLTELTAGALYHYRVIVRDAGYVESITADGTFVTPGDLQNGVKAYPNPCSISKDRKITFLVGAGVKAEVKIYTVTGRLVKEIQDENGAGEIIWDATNQAGDKVLTGVYLYKVTLPGGDSTTGKLAVLK